LSKALEGVAPLPETHLFDDSFVARSFPLIVKPRVGRGSRGIVLVRNQEELDHQERSVELIVQEYLPGEEYSVDESSCPQPNAKGASSQNQRCAP